MHDAEHLLADVEIARAYRRSCALALVLGRWGGPAEALQVLDELFEDDGSNQPCN